MSHVFYLKISFTIRKVGDFKAIARLVEKEASEGDSLAEKHYFTNFISADLRVLPAASTDLT